MPGQLPNEKKWGTIDFLQCPRLSATGTEPATQQGSHHTQTHTKGPIVDILFVVLFVLCSQVCVGKSLEKRRCGLNFFSFEICPGFNCTAKGLCYLGLTCSLVHLLTCWHLLTPVTCWHLLTPVDLLTCWPLPSPHPSSFPTVAFCILLDTS